MVIKRQDRKDKKRSLFPCVKVCFKYAIICISPGISENRSYVMHQENNRHYGGILVLAKASAIESYERINSKSENLLWFYIFLNMGSN